MTELRAPAAVLRVPPPPAATTAIGAVAAVAAVSLLDVTAARYVADAVALVASTAAAGLALFTSVFGLPAPYAERWRMVVRTLAVTAFAASLVAVALAVADVAGTGLGGMTDATARRAVLRGGIYQSALVRCVGLCGIALAFATRRPRRLLLVAAAIVTTGSLLLTGHVRDHGPAALVVLCALTHVIAVALWFGGLIGLAATLRAGGTTVARARLLASFASLMTGVIVMLLAGGAGLALLYLPTADALVSTAYGQVLLVKTGLVVATLVVSATNHRRLVPLASNGSPTALAALRMNIAVEQIALITVLLITGVLMQQNPVPS